jgi:hypothetical protein
MKYKACDFHRNRCADRKCNMQVFVEKRGMHFCHISEAIIADSKSAA